MEILQYRASKSSGMFRCTPSIPLQRAKRCTTTLHLHFQSNPGAVAICWLMVRVVVIDQRCTANKVRAIVALMICVSLCLTKNDRTEDVTIRGGGSMSPKSIALRIKLCINQWQQSRLFQILSRLAKKLCFCFPTASIKAILFDRRWSNDMGALIHGVSHSSFSLLRIRSDAKEEGVWKRRLLLLWMCIKSLTRLRDVNFLDGPLNWSKAIYHASEPPTIDEPHSVQAILACNYCTVASISICCQCVFQFLLQRDSIDANQ